MIDVKQFREYVVRPTLQALNDQIPYSEAAEELLMGTAAQESHLVYLHQLGGPARGVYQIEPETMNDIFTNYLAFRPELEKMVIDAAGRGANLHDELTTNLKYATIIARIIYKRVPEALPEATDVDGMATYWKKFYNTPLGRGTTEEFVTNYKTRILQH